MLLTGSCSNKNSTSNPVIQDYIMLIYQSCADRCSGETLMLPGLAVSINLQIIYFRADLIMY